MDLRSTPHDSHAARAAAGQVRHIEELRAVSQRLSAISKTFANSCSS